MNLILGSQSAGRKYVLNDAGYTYTVMPADIDEKAIRHDDLNPTPLAGGPCEGRSVAAARQERAVLITADSIAVWHGELREKPEDETEARRFMKSYSNDAVGNITGVVVTNTATGEQLEGVEGATTYFSELNDAAIEALIKDGFVMHCTRGLRDRAPPNEATYHPD